MACICYCRCLIRWLSLRTDSARARSRSTSPLFRDSRSDSAFFGAAEHDICSMEVRIASWRARCASLAASAWPPRRRSVVAFSRRSLSFWASLRAYTSWASAYALSSSSLRSRAAALRRLWVRSLSAALCLLLSAAALTLARVSASRCSSSACRSMYVL